ncbi:MAG TPA: hypothetical protein VFD49_17740 [Candidatus Dormibacteraeota bacterium]|nr:hypothetical protein [Candidatus Dormibacteraeota bacterium]
MTVLRIEHPVSRYEDWKRAFDSDPAGRARGGVRRYRVLRPIDDPNYVLIDLEFDQRHRAEAFLATLQRIWTAAGHTVSADQRARIVEVAAAEELP